MTARDVIARLLPGARLSEVLNQADHIIQHLTTSGYRILAPGELDGETVERCAFKVKNALENEAYDLQEIRDGYIAARKTGTHGGRRIKEDQAKLYAHGFRERSDAVFQAAETAEAAIRNLKESANE